jgi:fructose/tagatose bisphosphate aldolase
MIFKSVKDLLDAVQPAATVLTDRVSVTNPAAVTGELVDRLAWTSAFGTDAEVRGTARWVVRNLAAAAGIRPASIHDLYIAMGRGDAGGFTVPAINVRAMTYDTARAVIRSAQKLRAGAFIFEIARSEIGYTEQRPHEYAAVVIAAALREGFTGPLFIQGDHVQTNAKKYNSPERDKELETLRGLIKEEMAAGFYNIDIDTSTLVDLEKATLAEQQAVNVALAVDFTVFIRAHQPQGVTVSVGGEIGEVGGKNSDVHELHAYMQGFNAELKRRDPGLQGISKISVQTGTAHGGFINADGTLRKDVKIDLQTLAELSRLARTEYGLAGAVQHGASTLPPDAFEAFPRAGACEIHLATDFQNMVYDHPRFPADLRAEMYAWIRENALEERKPKDTEEQFLYKARKKAIGPFKQRMWNLDAATREAIGASLEERFTFLMKQLKINDTADVASRFGGAAAVPLNRDAEIVAAGGKITASEKKAEGLAD